MAKTTKTVPQAYPRIAQDSRKDYGCLDDSTLVPHPQKLPIKQLKGLIRAAITNANQKSSREILSVPVNATDAEAVVIYEREGKSLFKYFKKYSDDPAATADKLFGKYYREVAAEQFRNRTLQKERMNSGWRYQFLAHDCAANSGRFQSVSDMSADDGSFSVVIKYQDETNGLLSIDIDALENWQPHFIWPFLTNFTYEEMMCFVVEVLAESTQVTPRPLQFQIPEVILDSFGKRCRQKGIVSEYGVFNEPYELMHFLR